MTKIELCETGSTISNCLNPINITTGNGATADIASVDSWSNSSNSCRFWKSYIRKNLHVYSNNHVKSNDDNRNCRKIVKLKQVQTGTSGGAAGGAAGGHTGTAGSAILYVPHFTQDTTNYSMMEGSNADGSSLASLATVRTTDTHFQIKTNFNITLHSVAGSSSYCFCSI